MPSFTQRATFALTALAALASAAFDPQSKTNVAVYWGQGPYQARLLQTCQNPSVDIVNIAFVNAFPDNSPGGWPGSNFGNQCSGATYTHNGVSTLLQSSCPDIGPDIIACQQTYGKKILLSLGGAYPLTYYIASDTSANNFADFVWGAFGPSTSAWTNAGNPRPFGNAVVDGFDFDIESYMNPPPKDSSGNSITDYQTRGYATMINRLKNTLFGKDSSKSYYISGAPQCPLPDTHLSSVISAAWFDFLFVQFYNNPSCGARAAVTNSDGNSFLHWTQASSKNSAVKVYLGLPASTKASGTASDYITQSEALTLAKRFSQYSKFGGISLWESTYSQGNVACGQDYTTWMKKIVLAAVSGSNLNTDTTNCQATTTTTVKPVTTTTTVKPVTTTTTVKPVTTTTSVKPVTTSTTLTTRVSTTTTTSACATPSLTTVTFSELKTVVSGETVQLLGTHPSLGNGKPANAIVMTARRYTASNPQWYVNVQLPVGASFQYTYIVRAADGSYVRESNPNRVYTVPGNCAGTALLATTWR